MKYKTKDGTADTSPGAPAIIVWACNDSGGSRGVGLSLVEVRDRLRRILHDDGLELEFEGGPGQGGATLEQAVATLEIHPSIPLTHGADRTLIEWMLSWFVLRTDIVVKQPEEPELTEVQDGAALTMDDAVIDGSKRYTITIDPASIAKRWWREELRSLLGSWMGDVSEEMTDDRFMDVVRGVVNRLKEESERFSQQIREVHHVLADEIQSNGHGDLSTLFLALKAADKMRRLRLCDKVLGDIEQAFQSVSGKGKPIVSLASVASNLVDEVNAARRSDSAVRVSCEKIVGSSLALSLVDVVEKAINKLKFNWKDQAKISDKLSFEVNGLRKERAHIREICEPIIGEIKAESLTTIVSRALTVQRCNHRRKCFDAEFRYNHLKADLDALKGQAEKDNAELARLRGDMQKLRELVEQDGDASLDTSAKTTPELVKERLLWLRANNDHLSKNVQWLKDGVRLVKQAIPPSLFDANTYETKTTVQLVAELVCMVKDKRIAGDGERPFMAPAILVLPSRECAVSCKVVHVIEPHVEAERAALDELTNSGWMVAAVSASPRGTWFVLERATVESE